MKRLGFSWSWYVAGLALGLVLVFGVILPASAQGPVSYTPLTPLPGVPEGNIDVVTYLGSMYKFIIGFIIILAFGAFTYGGFMYVLSSVTSKKGEGKEWMTGAIYGLLIALASYLILYTINPELLELNIFRNFGRVGTTFTPPPPSPATEPRFVMAASGPVSQGDIQGQGAYKNKCSAAGGRTCSGNYINPANCVVTASIELTCVDPNTPCPSGQVQKCVPGGGTTGGGTPPPGTIGLNLTGYTVVNTTQSGFIASCEDQNMGHCIVRCSTIQPPIAPCANQSTLLGKCIPRNTSC